MNIPKIRSGIRLWIRSARLFILAIPNRSVMIPRWNQVVLCSKVIVRELFKG